MTLVRPGKENQKTHRTLLGNDVLFVERLDLSRAEQRAFDVVCLPLELTAADCAPARILLARQP